MAARTSRPRPAWLSLALLLGLTAAGGDLLPGLARAAPWRARGWGAACARARDYATAHWRPQQALRRGLAALRLTLLGDAVPLVWVGRDRWLFFADPDARQSMAHAPPFSPAEVDAWVDALEGRRRWLSARGAQLIVLLAPDKHTIYGDLLPERLRAAARGPSRLDQLVTALAARSRVEVVDPRAALRAVRATRAVFLPADTHWSPTGAFIAYQQVAAALARAHPTVRPLTWDDMQAHDCTPCGAGDLAVMADLQAQRPNDHTLLALPPALAPTVEWCPATGLRLPPQRLALARRATAPLRQLVVFRDSFFNSLLQATASHFRAVDVFDNANKFDDASIVELAPDVVILEVVERLLYRRPPPSPLDEARWEAPAGALSAAGAAAPRSTGSARRPRTPPPAGAGAR